VDGGGGRLLHNPAEHGKHSNAAVLELSLAQNLHIEDLREAEGVEADVTREGAVKVGGLLEEGHRIREGALEDCHLGTRHRCTNIKKYAYRRAIIVVHA
jgi:hypothetical protein